MLLYVVLWMQIQRQWMREIARHAARFDVAGHALPRA